MEPNTDLEANIDLEANNAQLREIEEKPSNIHKQIVARTVFILVTGVILALGLTVAISIGHVKKSPDVSNCTIVEITKSYHKYCYGIDCVQGTSTVELTNCSNVWENPSKLCLSDNYVTYANVTTAYVTYLPLCTRKCVTCAFTELKVSTSDNTIFSKSLDCGYTNWDLKVNQKLQCKKYDTDHTWYIYKYIVD